MLRSVGMGYDAEWTDTELPHLKWGGVEFCGAEPTPCHIGIHTSRLTAKPEESKSPTRVNKKGMCPGYQRIASELEIRRNWSARSVISPGGCEIENDTLYLRDIISEKPFGKR